MILRYMLSLLVLVVAAGAQAADDVVCPSMNANSVASTPTSRFEAVGGANVADFSGAPIVKDKVTGLMWAKCPLGVATNTLGECVASLATVRYTFADAVQAAEGSTLGSYTDWRVPNIKELGSIVERKCHSPAANLAVFAGTGEVFEAPFWTSTPVKVTVGYDMWRVDFFHGNSFYGGVTTSADADKLMLRVVRGPVP